MDCVIDFARSQKNMKAPCYALVSAWLKHNRVSNVPSDTQARRWWFGVGPVDGLASACELMGLEESNALNGDIAVVKQDGGDPILALIASNGFCVARAFGRMAVWKPEVIRSWRLPWER